MQLPARVCSAIQSAGQAVYHAQKELATAASEQTRKINEALQSGCVSKDVDTHVEALKTSVTLAEEMTRINERLAAAFAAANGATSGARDTSATTRAAEGRHSAQPRAASPSKAARSAKSKLRGNNAKVWDMLQKQLDTKEFLGVTQAQIAEEAGIPLGSVAYSVSRLQSLGLIEEGSVRGSYRLR